jgi:2-phospho-L-lactate guanylyltransferase
LSKIAVLIPFKADRRKTRLSRVLNPDQRRHLAELMLFDVLGAFSRAGLLSRCYVVSSDESVLALVRRSGARSIAETRDEGVNAAVRAGIRALGSDRGFMVVPADLPLLKPGEIMDVLKLKTGFGCVISPSGSFDGTNLLLFSGKAAPALSYDSDSFWNHVRGVARRGLSLAVYCGKGVQSDLDTPEDLLAFSRVRKRIPSVDFAREVIDRRES